MMTMEIKIYWPIILENEGNLISEMDFYTRIATKLKENNNRNIIRTISPSCLYCKLYYEQQQHQEDNNCKNFSHMNNFAAKKKTTTT